MILAIVIAVGIIILYQVFVLGPAQQERQAAAEAERATAAEAVVSDDAPTADPGDFAAGDVPTGAGMTREQALARSERIEIRTPSLSGTLALTGARFDDLQLLSYETEVDSGEPVTLLNPQGSPGGHFVSGGWLGGADAPEGLPGLSTDWRLVEGDVLTPDSPVVLEHRAGDLTFQRTITVDDNYLFTVTDQVTNNGAAPTSLRRYGLVRQEGVPDYLENFFILHEGAVGVVGDEMFDRKYKGWEEDGLIERRGEGGWMGITSKYWLTAVAPGGAPQMRGQFRVLDRPGVTVFEANYLNDLVAIAPGETLESVSHVFTGAKSQPVLARYENEAGIERLTMAIDWGMFWFMTRPFFAALHFFYGLVGNYGLAIMIVTLLIKAVLFPLNNRAFASMAKMRAVAPRMTEIRERNKDNPQAQQQAMMELYRKEKINPLAGCLPILPQIPIFFALYKTVFISLDARHAPFFGWIQDMSAPDPTTLWNVFGLLPYDPSGIPVIGTTLAIGIWPILMGITMWAQQSLNPPPPDKIQRQIFAFLPIVFTIVLAPFAAALVIYWTWNNFLTICQQYVIMRRQGVTTELDKRVLRLRAKMKGEPEPEFKDPYAPATGATLEEKASVIEGKAAEIVDGDDAGKPESGGEAPSEDSPRPAGRRVSSNPAAKKKRGSTPRKKPGGGR
jgi:YidC/Oxa1 family membrane protein insertase